VAWIDKDPATELMMMHDILISTHILSWTRLQGRRVVAFSKWVFVPTLRHYWVEDIRLLDAMQVKKSSTPQVSRRKLLSRHARQSFVFWSHNQYRRVPLSRTVMSYHLSTRLVFGAVGSRPYCDTHDTHGKFVVVVPWNPRMV
jgi:hypothetical protein